MPARFSHAVPIAVFVLSTVMMTQGVRFGGDRQRLMNGQEPVLVIEASGFWLVFRRSDHGAVSAEGRLGRGGSPEFQPVMGQANELPFGFQVGDAPHGELAETAGLLDLTAVFIH